ncbi:MAG: YihY/virulence factor BrkB family protein [bacterium]|nr:YihY/virulence factor BrkB family protein [bacterium]
MLDVSFLVLWDSPMRLVFTRNNIVPIVKDVIKNMTVNDSAYLAAGISFYAFLSLLPMCLVGVNVIGWLFSFPFIQSQASNGLDFLSGATSRGDTSFEYVVTLLKSFLPTNSSWVEQELKGLSENIGRNVIINLAIGMWSGRLMFMGLESSLCRVWGVPLQRTWIKRTLLALELVAVTWILGIIMLAGAGFLNIVKKLLLHLSLPELWGLSIDQAMLWSWVVSWIITPLGVSLIFMMVYRLLPAKPIAWSYIVPGALFSGFAYKITSYVYLIYAIHFAEVSVIYGSLWYIIGLLFWMFVVAFVFLIGAELIHSCETYEARLWEQERKARQSAAKKYAKRHKKALIAEDSSAG